MLLYRLTSALILGLSLTLTLLWSVAPTSPARAADPVELDNMRVVPVVAGADGQPARETRGGGYHAPIGQLPLVLTHRVPSLQLEATSLPLETSALAGPPSDVDEATRNKGLNALWGLPLRFVPNQGHTDEVVRYQVQSLGGKLFFTEEAVYFDLPTDQTLTWDGEWTDPLYHPHYQQSDSQPSAPVRLSFDNANLNPIIEGQEALGAWSTTGGATTRPAGRATCPPTRV